MATRPEKKSGVHAFRPKEVLRLMKELLNAIPESLPDNPTVLGPTRTELRETITVLVGRLQKLAVAMDPVRLPDSVLDPSDPQMMGKLIATTLLAQPRLPLSKLTRFYGSGVYAIYYNGEFDVYTALSGTETPIYVGKADPAEHGADSVVDQGERLSNRLRDHQRSIAAASNLRVEDFDCRYLVVKSAWQNTAETYLIENFQPIWNNEVGICFGFGKHGDSSETRKNTRSPWDTLHPGRKWAWTKSTVPNAASAEQIKSRILQHLKTHPPVAARL
ncbi:MAG: Eco29kI family restriction endonuclease [Planctomycetaceae bacterium]|nr:Eco29kI family restriction endonuclease [Planctomycetaceae bacterium]